MLGISTFTWAVIAYFAVVAIYVIGKYIRRKLKQGANLNGDQQ